MKLFCVHVSIVQHSSRWKWKSTDVNVCAKVHFHVIGNGKAFASDDVRCTTDQRLHHKVASGKKRRLHAIKIAPIANTRLKNVKSRQV